jgi:PAS domain S-box-containing protein
MSVNAVSLLQTMPWGVLGLAPDGTVAVLNPAAEALWGVPQAAILGLRPARVQPAVLPAELLRAFEQATAAPGLTTEAEYWLPHTQRWIALRTAADGNGYVWLYWDNVTARRQLADEHYKLQEAQAKQAASEALLRSTEEVARTGSYEVQLATMGFRFSDGMFRLFGEEPQSFTPSMEFIDSRSVPEDAVEVKRILDQAIQDRNPYYYNRRIYRADGQQRILESHGFVVCDEDGAPVQLLGQVQDVTERKVAEAKLTQATRTIQRMLDGSVAAIVLLDALRDAQGQVVDFVFRGANRSSELINQKTEAQLLGKRLLKEFPGVRTVFFDHYKQVMETGKAMRMVAYYPLEDINAWLDVTATRNGDGLILTYVDITDRKHAEQELHKQFQILQQAEEVAGMGSWEYDVLTDTLQWSEGMYRLFGLTPSSAVRPETYLDYTVADDRAVAERLVQALRTGTEPIDETLRIRVHDNTLVLKIKAVAQRDGQEQPRRMLGVDLDVTEVRRLEADNLDLRLQQQQTLFNAVLHAQETERRRIAESLHNGVGQLLYAIKLQLAQVRPAPLAPAWNRADELLVDAIRQTRALSHEIMPTVLAEEGLEAAFQDICRQLSSQQLHFACHVALEHPVPQQLQISLFRMAQELAQNAVKHAHATEATLALETVPGYVLLRAEDNGVGFEAALDYSSGIGLRSIRNQVALLGGTLDLGSSPIFGTYVRMRIPLSAIDPAADSD